MPRWAVWALVAVAALLLVGPRLMPTPERARFTYTEFLELVEGGDVRTVTINNLNNQITGTLLMVASSSPPDRFRCPMPTSNC